MARQHSANGLTRTETNGTNINENTGLGGSVNKCECKNYQALEIEETVSDWAHDGIQVDRLTAKAWSAFENKKYAEAEKYLLEASRHIDRLVAFASYKKGKR